MAVCGCQHFLSNSFKKPFSKIYILNFSAECQRLNKELTELKQTLEHTQVSIEAEQIIQDLQDQNRRAHEEIQTLQTLVNETVDESINTMNQAKNFSDVNEKLKQEINQLKDELASQVSEWLFLFPHA